MTPVDPGHRPGAVARVLVLLVGGYRRLLSPLLPPRCRFAPSCSRYAVDALQLHGAVRGGWLALRRVARCHPFHPGGHDPVPERLGAAARSVVPVDGTAVDIPDASALGVGDDGCGSVVPASPAASTPAPALPALPLGARS